MRRIIVVGVLLSILAASCGTDGEVAAGPTTSAPPPSTTASGEGATTLLRCDDVEPARAPDEWYRASPVYVANEMPIEEVEVWARQRPGYEGIWIDRDRLGWISVAFSEEADVRQAELEEVFPGVGVVAVPVDWSAERLEQLQELVVDELAGRIDSFGVGSGSNTGVVAISLGVLTDETVAALEELFAGQPVCIEGTDPADAPAPGPQVEEGDRWWLLASDQGAGEPYRTGIATDQDSYLALWSAIGLGDAPPPVDFQVEVVIWFGAVYGSSCPNLRLDDVVVDHDAAVVHAEIVLPDAPVACTADANPHAYVVAVERTALPAGPFAIQLDADGPPGGAPEERTVVSVDLTAPGAVAAPNEIGPDPELPAPFSVTSGDVIEPGFPVRYRLYTHCGIEWLGELNGVVWRTDVPGGVAPAAWQAIDGETIELTIVLMVEPEPLIVATANGFSVEYRPTSDPIPGCD